MDMEKVKIPEISLTSDSDDLIDDFWFKSPRASFDGSSVNSIPWAEDVVKQNQDLWDQVERMFYGEESLPTNDVKLRNEIIEWTKHFPYLRVCGEQMPIHSKNNMPPNETYPEEIIAVHPSQQSSAYSVRRNADTNETHRYFCEKYQRYPEDSITDGSLVNDIEKCMRITSGPLLSRRAQNSRTAYSTRSFMASNNLDTNHHRNKQGLKSALISVRSSYDMGSQFRHKMYGSVDVERLHSVPYSARIMKIPSLKTETSDLNMLTTNKRNMIRMKTATLKPISRPLRNSITLPAINIEPKYFDRSNYNNNNEAISALIHQNNVTRVSQSPMAKKRSESE